MAVFEYQALDARGRSKKGSLEGDSTRQARQKLKEKGLTVIEVKLSQQRSKNKDSAFSFRRGIGAMDLALITRQLSTLLQSGMPIESSLQAVAEQTEKNTIRSVITSVRSKVTEGYTLGESLGEQGHIFDVLYRSMVVAGERSGHLDLILDRLATYTEHRQKMNSKLLQALLYPIILVVVAFAVVTFLVSSVVPKLIEQFIHMGQKLPGSTEALMTMSGFMQEWGILVAILTFSLVVVFRYAMQVPNFAFKVHQRLLFFPLLGKVIKGLNTARFARTLAICSSSNIPILDGMMVARDVVTNLYMKQKVQEAAEAVREGISLRKALQSTGLFPPMMLHMIASGEQSGELEKMLINAADNQDNQFESTVNIALGIFTPVLITLMAGVVLFIVMATLMPILEMNNLMTR
ncbi:type II secretion system inner membrane protein GspF [Vibrio sp. RC27]